MADPWPNVFSGLGSGIVVAVASWIKGRYNRMVKVHLLAENAAKAEDLGIRDMVVTMYNAFVPPKPRFGKAPLGIMEQIESIDNRVQSHEHRLDELAEAIAEVAHGAALDREPG